MLWHRKPLPQAPARAHPYELVIHHYKIVAFYVSEGADFKTAEQVIQIGSGNKSWRC
jgi:hypothetical protein